MISNIIQYLFIFISGSMLGWCLEVVYRRYLGKARKWINPGFLSGPFLPIYGNGFCVLYFISAIDLNIYYKLLLFILITTLLEYITGLFFLKYYKIRLWDYSQLRFNIQGIVSPLYSVLWGILSMVYYFLIYPIFTRFINLIYNHLEYSLIIGIFIGIMLVDMGNSFNIVSKLKKFAEAVEDFSLIINYEQLKLEIREQFEHFTSRFEKLEEDIEDNLDFNLSSKLKQLLKRRQQPSFMLPFRGDSQLNFRLQEMLKNAKQRRKK